MPTQQLMPMNPGNYIVLGKEERTTNCVMLQNMTPIPIMNATCVYPQARIEAEKLLLDRLRWPTSRRFI
ncbi:unnamed protein product [Penicillium roqueforti FM164]|uniref:Uncharacterized protein n=1 Tax=Penicillium roqueforti (strain FM164) TaxID=1365484 RepID=W6QLM3_PENRF|nr:unnamed protein product [Penicillium roqueforti FM164]